MKRWPIVKKVAVIVAAGAVLYYFAFFRPGATNPAVDSPAVAPPAGEYPAGEYPTGEYPDEVGADRRSPADAERVLPSADTSSSSSRSSVSSGAHAPALTGRVVDDFGTAIAGVLIRAVADAATDAGANADADADAGPAIETDAGGRFRLSPPTGVDLAVVATHPHFAPRVLVRGVRVENRSKTEVDLGDCVLPACAGLLVEVRTESGLPIAGAKVVLQPMLSPIRLPPYAVAVWTRRAAADRSGIATFYGVEAGPWMLRVSANGRATTHTAHLQPEAPESAPRAVLNLHPGQLLAGRVLDADDRPVAGAVVGCRSSHGGSADAQTDAKGEFRLEGLGPGRVHVVVSSEHGVSSRDGIDPGEGLLTLRLPRGREVRGRVLAGRDRRPIAGATVVAQLGSGWPTIRGGRISGPQTTTDAEGKFVFLGLPPGIVTLAASSKDLCPAAHLLQPTNRPVILLLEEGFRLTGQILSHSGLPLRNALIETIATPADHVASPSPAAPDRARGQVPQPVRSGDGGRFAVSGLRPGRFRILVRAPRHAPFLSGTIVATPNGREDRGAIRLIEGIGIHGRAFDAADRPAAGATVYLRPIQDLRPIQAGAGRARAGSIAKCDAGGHFQVPAVAPGVYRMFYDYPDRETPWAAAATRAATSVQVHVKDQRILRRDLRPRVR